MQVRRQRGVIIGFTEIFTSDYPDPTGIFLPKKSPYIAFKLPKLLPDIRYQYFNQVYLDTKTTIKTLANLGLTETKNGYHCIAIRGHRKVAEAIKLFKTLEEYPSDVNQQLITYLNQYQQSCEEWYNNHPKKIPHKSKPLSSFTDLNGNSVDLNSARRTSFNPTITIKKKDSGSLYVMKTYPADRGIANFESGNGVFHRLMRGVCHPKTRILHDDKGKRLGSLSKKYSNFTSIRKYANKYGPISADLIISSEMVKDFVLFYTEQEDDANSNNYGFVEFTDSTGKKILLSVKLDNDRMMWGVVCKYFGIDPEGLDPDSNSTVKPSDTFPIFTLNLSNFPILPKKVNKNDWVPGHWFNNAIQSVLFEKNWEEKAFKSEKFIHDRNYMYLKRILATDDVIEAIGDAKFPSEVMKSKFIESKIETTSNLRVTALHNNDILKYLTNRSVSEDFIQILNEFNDYNKDFKKPEDHFLHIDLQSVKDKFYHIQNQAQINLHIIPSMPYSPPISTITTQPSSLKLANTPPNTPNTPNNENTESNQHKKRKAEEDEGSRKRQKLHPTTPPQSSGTKTSDSSLTPSETLSIVKACLIPNASKQTNTTLFVQQKQDSSIPIKTPPQSKILQIAPQQYSGIFQVRQQQSIPSTNGNSIPLIPQQYSGIPLHHMAPPPIGSLHTNQINTYFSGKQATTILKQQNYSNQNIQTLNSTYRDIDGLDQRIINRIQGALSAKTWNGYTGSIRQSMINLLKIEFSTNQANQLQFFNANNNGQGTQPYHPNDPKNANARYFK